MLQKTRDLQEKLMNRTSIWFHKKIGWRFFLGLQLFSFFIYGIISLFTELLVFNRSLGYLLYTPYVPFYMNPLHVVLLCILYAMMYLLYCHSSMKKKRGDIVG